MNTLICIRGVSKSGKSSFAKFIKSLYSIDLDCKIFEADHFFEDEQGNYNFDLSKRGEAHKQCIKNVENSMVNNQHTIIVSNTSTTQKELNVYLDLAEKYKYKVFSIIIERRHNGENNRNVPEDTLERQEKNLRNSLKLR